MKRVWVSNPSWPNHKSVFTSAGLEVREYAYYDAANHALDFDGLLASLNEAPGGRRGTVPRLLPQPDRYRSDARSVAAAGAAVGGKGWLPLFDFAYQASPAVWKKMLKGYALLLLYIKSCWSPAPTRKTLACTTSASAPALWSPRIKRL